MDPQKPNFFSPAAGFQDRKTPFQDVLECLFCRFSLPFFFKIQNSDSIRNSEKNLKCLKCFLRLKVINPIRGNFNDYSPLLSGLIWGSQSFPPAAGFQDRKTTFWGFLRAFILPYFVFFLTKIRELNRKKICEDSKEKFGR